MKRLAVARGAVNIRFLFVLLLVAGVLVLGAGGTWYFQKKYRARNALAQARSAVEQAKWSESMDHYRTYLRQNPNDLAVLREFSQSLRKARPQELEHVLSTITADRRILRLDTSDRETFRRLLKLYAATENYSDLAFMAGQTPNLKLAPEDLVAAKLYAARADVGLTRWKDAAQKVEEVLRETVDIRPVSPTYVDALVLKARILERSQPNADPDQIREPLELAFQSDPQAAEAPLYLSRLDRKAAEAEPELDIARSKRERAKARLQSLEPPHAVDQVRLAAELLELDEIQGAQKCLTKAEQAADPIGPDEFLLTQDYVLFTFILKAQLAMLQGKLPDGSVAFVDQALEQLKERRYQLLAQPEAIRTYLLAHQLASDTGDSRAKEYLAQADTLFTQYVENSKLENQPPPAEMRALLEGLLAHRHGDYYRAASVLEPYAKPDVPESAELWGLLADTYGKLGQVRRAATAADRYIRLRGRASREIRLQQLTWYMQSNDWVKAQKAVEQWTDLEDNDVERHAIKLRVELRTALNADSVRQPPLIKGVGERLDQLLARNPTSTRLLEVKADWLAAQNRTSEAEATWKQAVANSDDPNRARLGLAEFYATGEQHGSAVATLQEYLNQNPNAAESWIRLADLQIAAGQYDQATESIRRGRAVAETQNQAGLLRIFAIKPAEIELARDNVAAANQQLEELAAKEEFKKDANLRRFWLRALKNRGDDVLRQHIALAQRLVDELRQIETDNGVEWRVWQADLLLLNRPVAADRSRAIAYLQAAREADPDWESVIVLLGKAYELNEDWRAAEALYLAATQRHPENPRLARQLAYFYKIRGREGDLRKLLKSEAFSEGIRNAQEVVELIERGEYGAARDRLVQYTTANPRDVDAKIFLVQLDYRMNQDLDRALTDLDQIAKDSNDASNVFSARINLLFAAGRAPEALKLLDQRVADRNDAASYALRAKTRQDAGDMANAESDYKKVLELSPHDVASVQALASFYVDTRRNDDAVNVLQEAVTRSSNSTALKRLLSKVLLVRNRPEDRTAALALLDELDSVQSRTADPELLKLRAVAMLEDGRSRAEATQLLEQAVVANPLMEDAHLTLIQLAMQDNDLAKAQRLLERAFEPLRDAEGRANSNRDGPLDAATAAIRPRLIAMRAELEAARGDTDRARNSFAQALDLDPGSMEALRGLSRLAIGSKDARTLELLESRLEAALRAEPLNSEVVVLRSQALSARGQRQEAQRSLESFATEHPQAAGAALLLSLADFADAASDAAATKRWIDKAYELSPKDESVLRAKLMLFGRERDYAGLHDFVEKTWTDRSLQPSLAPLAATLLRQSGDAKHRVRAEEVMVEASRRIAPDDPAQLTIIAALYEAERYDQALAIGEKYLEKKPNDVEALNSQAWILGIIKHDYKQALSLADRGLAANARHASLLDTRGQLLMHENKPAAAFSDFRLAAQVAKQPKDKAQALLNCARAAAAASDPEGFSGAMRDLHKIENLDKLLTATEREELQKLQAPPSQ